MYKICFIDEDLTVLELGVDISSLASSFFVELWLYLRKDFTILNPIGDVVATCFDSVFEWC